MRPRGEVRQALSAAAQALAAEAGAASWRDMAARANVGVSKAREVVKDMHRAGELARVGFEKRAHSRAWVALYAPAAPQGSSFAVGPLDRVLRAWAAR